MCVCAVCFVSLMGTVTSYRRKMKTLYLFELPFIVVFFFFCQAATTLSKSTLAKYTADKTTLPEDLHYDADKLFRLFIKPKIMVSGLLTNVRLCQIIKGAQI